ncbi:MAG: TraR/DksA C4-type zinc finger protein [Gammaproteobacteria bacterium]|nr:TraR/DksA C4-type zinc finger protein [Gammaproteobacteria bacterium]MCZ6895987.1 TraR/DksA C4-type zinc finger protein [Gammaproteobacteria bacterium]
MKSAAAWREVLLARRSEIEADLETGAAAAQPVELDQARVGRVSRMDAMQAQAMSAAANHRRQTQIACIATALSRIEDGIFGACITCGDEISEQRLDIDATVLQCIDCAEQAESNSV